MVVEHMGELKGWVCNAVENATQLLCLTRTTPFGGPQDPLPGQGFHLAVVREEQHVPPELVGLRGCSSHVTTVQRRDRHACGNGGELLSQPKLREESLQPPLDVGLRSAMQAGLGTRFCSRDQRALMRPDDIVCAFPGSVPGVAPTAGLPPQRRGLLHRPQASERVLQARTETYLKNQRRTESIFPNPTPDAGG